MEGGLECLLVVLRPRRTAGRDQRLGLGFDELLDDVEAHLLAVLLGDPTTFLVEPGGQSRGDLSAVLRDQLPVQLDLAIRAAGVLVLLRCGRHKRAQAELRAGAARQLALAFAGPGAGEDRQRGRVVVLDDRRGRRGAVGTASSGERRGLLTVRGMAGLKPLVCAQRVAAVGLRVVSVGAHAWPPFVGARAAWLAPRMDWIAAVLPR